MKLAELRIEEAGNFWQRLRGRMFAPPLQGPAALLLRDCAAVHTCFVRGRLDLVYLDADARVTRLVPGLAPWRVSRGSTGTRHTLELAGGAIGALDLRVGDSLATHPTLQLRRPRRQ